MSKRLSTAALRAGPIQAIGILIRCGTVNTFLWSNDSSNARSLAMVSE